MPAKANDSTSKRSGPSPALRRAKDTAEKLQRKLRDKTKEYREQRIPNALMQSTGTVVGAVPTGIACGLVPEKYTTGAGTEIPTGLIMEGVSVVGGIAVAGGSAAMGWEYPIHMGAGMLSTGVGMLVKRGVSYGREMAMEWWNERQGTPVRNAA